MLAIFAAVLNESRWDLGLRSAALATEAASRHRLVVALGGVQGCLSPPEREKTVAAANCKPGVPAVCVGAGEGVRGGSDCGRWGPAVRKRRPFRASTRDSPSRAWKSWMLQAGSHGVIASSAAAEPSLPCYP